MQYSLNEIDLALASGEFHLVYLPTVDIVSKQVVGAEALLRWTKEGRTIPAADFVPVFENSPLSGAITYWVLEQAGRELSAWLASDADLHLSVNISPELLGRGGIAYATGKSGLAEHWAQLVFEVTERGILDGLGLEGLSFLSSRGARLALDDVRLSPANMAMLVRCPYEFIKLDYALTAELSGPEARPAWLDAIAGVIAKTDLEVIAEGVETEHQMLALREAGIRLAQGFWFSRPIPATELIALGKTLSPAG